MTSIWDVGRIGRAFLVSHNKTGNGAQKGPNDSTHLAEEDNLGKASKDS